MVWFVRSRMLFNSKLCAINVLRLSCARSSKKQKQAIVRDKAGAFHSLNEETSSDDSRNLRAQRRIDSN